MPRYSSVVFSDTDPSAASTRGDRSAASTRGDPSAASTRGDRSAASTRGDPSAASTSDRSAAYNRTSHVFNDPEPDYNPEPPSLDPPKLDIDDYGNQPISFPIKQIQIWYMLGKYYDKKGDPEKAVKYYNAAALSRHVPAQMRIGVMYLTGDGVPEDEALGLKYLGLTDAHQFTLLPRELQEAPSGGFKRKKQTKMKRKRKTYSRK